MAASHRGGRGARQLTDIRRELDRLRENDAEVARRVDFLGYQVGEISTANLRPTEYDDLTLERDRVANAERIITLCDHAYRALYDGLDRRESVMDLFGQVSKDLSQLEQLDPSLRQNLESVDALMHQVDELARALRRYRDDIEYSPDHLDELEERLDLINRLRRKYGSTIGEILAFGERASQELEELNYREERAEGLKAREMDLRGQVGQLAGQLSEARQHAARGLADAIQEEVAGLAFGHAQVLVEIRQLDSERVSKKEKTWHAGTRVRNVLAVVIWGHESTNLSYRPERPGVAIAGTIAASAQTRRPSRQVPSPGGGERHPLCTAHRVLLADAAA